MRFDHRISCSEADTVSLSYTPCYVRLTRHSHETSYVVADPFTNKLVFFLCQVLSQQSTRSSIACQENYMSNI